MGLPLAEKIAASRSGSTIGVFSVKHARDLQYVTFVTEKEAVVLGTQTNQRRLHTLKLTGIALAGLGVSRQGFQDLECG